MKRKFYAKLKPILKCEWLTNFVATLLAIPFWCIYYIVALFDRIPTRIDPSVARAELEQAFPNRISMPEAKVCPLDPSVDVSVIIPCYNVEKYVGECVDSVLAQGDKYNLQIICVNDGSTDKTLDILQGYGDKITIIDKANGGLSSARNAGMDIAVGKYIFFIDSDDYILPDCIDVCMQKMAEGDYDRVKVAHCQYEGAPKNISTKGGFAWGVLYKREIFDHLRFPSNVLFEDSINPFVVYTIAPKLCVIEQPYYMYRIVPTSITAIANRKVSSISHLYVSEFLAKYSKDNGYLSAEKLYENVLYQYSSLCYSRVRKIDKRLIKDMFVLASQDYLQYRLTPSPFKMTINQKQIDKALSHSYYLRWKLACEWL